MEQKGLAVLRRHLKRNASIETPCYVYDKARILNNIATLRRNFGRFAQLYFAVKANTNLSILKLIKEKSIGAEVVSPGEIYVCLKAGYKGSEILYNNVARKEEDIEYAIEHGVTSFNFESIDQAILLDRAGTRLRKNIKCFARINPGIFSKTHPHLSTGSRFSKFGIEMNELPDAARAARKFRFAQLVGIHCHIGSQILSPRPFIKAITKVAQAIEYFRSQRFEIGLVNLGGGFGVPYSPKEKPLDFAPIIECYSSLKKRYQVEILLEPGRFFVADAGYILTRIIDKKTRNRVPLNMIDAGMTENPRPALYDAYHHIEPLFKTASHRKLTRITGPLCENADEFGTYPMPALKIGAYLLIHNSGAYTRTMASTYNGRPLPAEYLVDGTLKLIRRKQPLGGLIENEKY